MTFPNYFCILCVHCCGFCSIVSEVSRGPEKDVLKCLTPKMGGEGVLSLEVPPQQGRHFSWWRLVPTSQQSEVGMGSQRTALISGGQGPYCPLWPQKAAPGAEATKSCKCPPQCWVCGTLAITETQKSPPVFQPSPQALLWTLKVLN